MKVAVIGYSGAGKSTLAQRLGAQLGEPVLHLDAVGWAAGWRLRDEAEAREALCAFLDDHDGWVVDGNWFRLDGGRRFAEADLVAMLDFPRWRCLARAWRRYRANRGCTRADQAEGCPEKFDRAFLRWILRDGRTRAERARYARIVESASGRTAVLRTPGAVEDFCASLAAR